jgi:hypothetical protein
VVTGRLTGCSTLRRHFYVTGVADSPLHRKCGAQEEPSAQVLCKCETLATLDITMSTLEICKFIKGTEVP